MVSSTRVPRTKRLGHYLLLAVVSLGAVIGISDAVFLMQDKLNHYEVSGGSINLTLDGHYAAIATEPQWTILLRKSPWVPLVPWLMKRNELKLTVSVIAVEANQHIYAVSKPTESGSTTILMVGKGAAIAITMWGTSEFVKVALAQLENQVLAQGLKMGEYGECLAIVQGHNSKAP